MNANAWPITTDQVTPDHLPMAVDRVAFAGEIVAVVAARTRRRGPRRRRAGRRGVRGAAGRARPQGGRGGHRARAPRPRHQQVGVLAARLRRAGQRPRDRRGARGGPPRRHRHRAGVPPAAADPGVHGAALDRRRPDRRADHDVVGHPDPAHHPVPARGHHRRARVQDPGDRPRRGRRLRRQAADDARGVDHLVRRRAGSASPASTPRPARSPWCRATTAATSGRS